ncbi:ankyrin repeat domain-containing protein [Endozoicomonas lisbonensis]
MPLHEPLLHTLINTDLFYSVSVGNLERVLFLLNQHPRQARILDHNRHSLLSYAVRHGHDDIIRSLWASLMPDFPDIDGNNLMHLAVQYNQTSTIRLLLSLGYPLNNRNRRGETPLFQSVLEGHEFATRQLLSQGANPDIADNTSQRPLQIAFARGHTNQVISLIEHQLAPIENALGRYMDIQTAETEAIAVNCLIGHSSADNTFTNGVYGHSLIRSPHRQNLLRLCQNLRSQAGQLAQALLLNQATQQSLFHDLQLRGPEHQNRLEEQRQQLQAFRERLQQVLQRLQNDLQRIRQNACNGQAR